MVSATAAPPPPAGPPALPAPPRSPSPALVEWTGRIPEALASFLQRLGPAEVLELYGLIGRYAEVRRLVSIARRVHQILERGPHTAASGRWSFAEFMAAKDEIGRLIQGLADRVEAAASEARVAFPRTPFRRTHDHAPDAA